MSDIDVQARGPQARAPRGLPDGRIVPHDEWGRAPWNRYTFQHVDRWTRTMPVRRVLPAEWITETRRGNHRLFQGSYRQALPDGAYRNRFWIENAGRRALIGRGVFGQLVYVDPEAEFVAVKLSSWPHFTDVGRLRESLAAVRALRDALGCGCDAIR